jgi:hypothetical protein
MKCYSSMPPDHMPARVVSNKWPEIVASLNIGCIICPVTTSKCSVRQSISIARSTKGCNYALYRQCTAHSEIANYCVCQVFCYSAGCKGITAVLLVFETRA